MIKKIARNIFFSFLTFILCILSIWLLERYFNKDLYKEINKEILKWYQEVPDEMFSPFHIDRDFVYNLGWWDFNYNDSFYNKFPLNKEKSLRIGLFGGSFMKGEEALSFQDPASFANQYAKKRNLDLEILNFSFPGFGVFQSYSMWEELHQKYHLDAAVIFIPDFHVDRDITFVFNRGDGFHFTTPPHALYVVENEKLKKIKIQGKSWKENIDSYYGFLPDSLYFQYDYYLPPIFSRFLNGGRKKIKNPIFSLTKPIDKVLPVYKKIISIMSKKMEKVIIISNSGDILDYLKVANNVDVIEFSWLEKINKNPSFYKTACCHPNSLIYYDFSQFILNAFNFKTDYKFNEVIIFKNIEIKPDAREKLKEFDNVELLLDDKKAMQGLYFTDPLKKLPDLSVVGIYNFTKKDKLKSYKSLYYFQTDIIKEINFLPSNEFAQSGDVYLKNDMNSIKVGSAKLINQNFSLIELDDSFGQTEFNGFFKHPSFNKNRIDIVINDKVIGLFQPTDAGYRLLGLGDDLITMRFQADRDLSSNINELLERGDVFLKLTNISEKSFLKINLFDYYKEKIRRK